MVENLTKIKKCDLCGSEASEICFKCKEYFCDKCYEIIHNIKKDNGHNKYKIDPYLFIDLFCNNHSDYPLELYCFEDKGN